MNYFIKKYKGKTVKGIKEGESIRMGKEKVGTVE